MVGVEVVGDEGLAGVEGVGDEGLTGVDARATD